MVGAGYRARAQQRGKQSSIQKVPAGSAEDPRHLRRFRTGEWTLEVYLICQTNVVVLQGLFISKKLTGLLGGKSSGIGFLVRQTLIILLRTRRGHLLAVKARVRLNIHLLCPSGALRVPTKCRNVALAPEIAVDLKSRQDAWHTTDSSIAFGRQGCQSPAKASGLVDRR